MAANFLRYKPADFERHIHNAVMKYKDSHCKGVKNVSELIKKLKSYGTGSLP